MLGVVCGGDQGGVHGHQLLLPGAQHDVVEAHQVLSHQRRNRIATSQDSWEWKEIRLNKPFEEFSIYLAFLLGAL